ncbi:MAG: AIPR family protein [Gloeocapsa sp. UFS-A4-WI-NPMV-4B04]|nr:AIPR family protein [Gloeocapsa sp. UFS-A4-WI-NPMV-4B04]
MTILTLEFEENKRNSTTTLQGVSIINGAQTTGSIGSVDITKYDLKEVKVLCRVIQCSDADTISQIVKYNNTQNEITTWDQYSNSPEQKRIADEFKTFGHEYSLKRGFSSSSVQLGIEQVIQPLLAFTGDYTSASRGKNSLFERRSSYEQAFKDKKARHILFVHTLSKAIQARKIELSQKQVNNNLVTIEEKQINLFRNLTFKSFLIAVTGKYLEVIIEKKTDLSQIEFTTEASNINNKSINDLVALWLPIVTTVLAFVGNVIDKDLSELLSEENALESISSRVVTSIYVSQATNPNPVFTSFKSFVCPKG